MTQQFEEGHDIEVYWPGGAIHSIDARNWRKAKVSRYLKRLFFPPRYEVEFPDGSRAVFNPEHVRAVK